MHWLRSLPPSTGEDIRPNVGQCCRILESNATKGSRLFLAADGWAGKVLRCHESHMISLTIDPFRIRHMNLNPVSLISGIVQKVVTFFWSSRGVGAKDRYCWHSTTVLL